MMTIDGNGGETFTHHSVLSLVQQQRIHTRMYIEIGQYRLRFQTYYDNTIMLSTKQANSIYIYLKEESIKLFAHC